MTSVRLRPLRQLAGWAALAAVGAAAWFGLTARHSSLPASNSRIPMPPEVSNRQGENPEAPGDVLDAAAADTPDPASSGALDWAIPPEIDAQPFGLDIEPETLVEQRETLFRKMQVELNLNSTELSKIVTIFSASRVLSQGNPQISEHLISRKQCRKIRAQAKHIFPAQGQCKALYMVPVYNPERGETPNDAKVCIDQFEFPNIPCEYPVTWVRASEADAICKAMNKRLCDAHEWEGACAGALLPAESEYAWQERRLMQEYLHNQSREITWAYGKEKKHALCATGSHKSPKCFSGGWNVCGTNTYPAGSFPDCVSRFGVYDQHGNAAEHMNYALKPEQLASRGGLGETEMKGSWFIFSQLEAHLDDCRWRAPDWHATPIADPTSHRNYHLGFRCCKDL